MLKNYLTVAVRKLWRNKAFSIINIAGLAVGIALFVLIFQYVASEWGSNRFHTNYDNLFRIVIDKTDGGKDYEIPTGLAPMLTKFPDITHAVRVAGNIGGGTIEYQPTPGKGADATKYYTADQTLFVDGDFFKAFTFPLADGVADLTNPQTMAISETLSKKLFNTSQASGRQVIVHNQFSNTPYTITGVFKDMPENSDIQSEVLLSLNTLSSAANRDGNDWANPTGLTSSYCNLYLATRPGADTKRLKKQMDNYWKTIQPSNMDASFFLQPFSQLHLAPNFTYPYQTYGSLLFVTMLMAVAVIILCIAWINYINLSSVQSLTRAKETGVRKVLGATRQQLIAQYLSESLLLTIAAVLVATLLIVLLQPVFNTFTGKNLALASLGNSHFWLLAIVAVVAGSALSGGYVALVLASFKPVAAFKENSRAARGFSFKKGLVVFQFTISIVFIIATLVLYRQLQYMKTGNLGVSLNELIIIKGPTVASDEQSDKNIAFKNAVLQQPFVQKFAGSNNVPGRGYNFQTDGITSLHPQKDDDKKSYNMFICDNSFFNTYNISFAQGKAYDEQDANRGWAKAKKVVINETAAKQLGLDLSQNLVGQKIQWGQQYEIAGVIKDYHHLSFQKAIDPIIFLPSVSFVYFTVQTSATGMQTKLATLRQLYKQYFGANEFSYQFADEVYNRQYQQEDQLGQIFIASAMVAILIACMGLFGLAAFTARQRVKEIGIRKVLGASVLNITSLLSTDFARLVLLAAIIAFPLAGYGMQQWLNNFAYHIELSWWMFLVAGVAAMAIALLTISYQTIKAATSNPAESLKNE